MLRTQTPSVKQGHFHEFSSATGSFLAVAVPYSDIDAQHACCGAVKVEGMNPNGNGLVAVRMGQGLDYPMIGEIHDGNRLGTYAKRDSWRAFSRGPEGTLSWARGNWLGNHVP